MLCLIFGISRLALSQARTLNHNLRSFRGQREEGQLPQSCREHLSSFFHIVDLSMKRRWCISTSNQVRLTVNITKESTASIITDGSFFAGAAPLSLKR